MKLILSLDGGGIREEFVLQILLRIEQTSGKRIRELFDMVIGVSAGAMAAGAIASGLHDLDGDLLRLDKIFPTSNKTNGLFSTVYDGTGKQQELERVFKNMKMSDAQVSLAILTAKVSNGEAVTFTSDDVDASVHTVASIIDASSSAPVYFPPTKIGEDYYMDGGIVCNDPVLAALDYAQKKWGKNEKFAVLSLGTGTSTHINVNDENPQDFGLMRWLASGLLSIMTDTRRNYFDPVIRQSLGSDDRYLRVTSNISASLDSAEAISELKEDARRVWNSRGEKIMRWLSAHATK